MADNNHLRTIPLRAPRGIVFDRNGSVLVENTLSYTIAIQRELTKNMDQTIRRIAAATGVDEARIRDAVQRRRREPVFRPLPVIEHATFAQVAAVTARRFELPEVLVQQVPARTYPTAMAGHLFGYVGEIQEAQLQQSEFSGLQPGAIVGQAGLEKVYNSKLMGTDGNRYVVVNSSGREMDKLMEEPPVEGQRVQLTIDKDVQTALEDGFRVNGFSGAAAVMDPRTGEILAMTSLPAYDPNTFAVGIDGSSWSRLLTDPLRPMTNRLIQGTYSPGSTFKIVMAIAGLEEGVITPETTFYCPGHATFYGHTFACDRKTGHGTIDLRHAIEQSCNVYFYNVGDRLGVDRINKYARMFGLVGKTGIDLPGEVDSLVPSTEWKQKTFKEKWYAGETISVAIGQGAVTVTPLALGTMVATVANGGTLITPHLARAADAGDGRGWQPFPPPAPRSQLAITPAHLQAVRDGMWLAVNGAGTSGRARIDGKDVSGKTGTAQVISNQGKAAASGKGLDLRDNGWFIFFAPRDNPQISGVIFVEHGGHGGTAAAPIAKHVMETFFAKAEGRPLPPPPEPNITVQAAPAATTPATRVGTPAPAAPRTPRPATPRPAPGAGGLR